jgi:hypothetical protein
MIIGVPASIGTLEERRVQRSFEDLERRFTAEVAEDAEEQKLFIAPQSAQRNTKDGGTAVQRLELPNLVFRRNVQTLELRVVRNHDFLRVLCALCGSFPDFPPRPPRPLR